MANGEIVAVQGNGLCTLVWSSAIAGSLPSTPAGWGPTAFVSFVQFNGELVACNGRDKPLLVNKSGTVGYLSDLATGSNLNTPIAKYVCVCRRYLIMAGDPLFPNRVHISARDTSGTFYGDPAPNDATFVDVGSSLPNSSSIRGIANFRDRLIVAYPEGTVLGTLGNYTADGTAHEPDFDDTIELYGAVSHRSIIAFGEDCLFMDRVGVPSIKRNIYTGSMLPQRTSDYIDPDMTIKLSALNNVAVDEQTWAVYNQREGQFMFFVPNTSDPATTTETKCYVYNYRPNLSINAWSRFDDWNFTCGVRSAEDNIFFGDVQGRVWLHGSHVTPIYADAVDDPKVNMGAGAEIAWEWELPWSDFGRRLNTKSTRYFNSDTRGTATFTASMYLDRLMYNGDGSPSPALEMDFVGGDFEGVGDQEQPFGGGRMTADGRLYMWPAKFLLAKMHFEGSSKLPLRFVSLDFWYMRGGNAR
jgi:hypothetical protein